jgi:hypothetical protein
MLVGLGGAQSKVTQTYSSSQPLGEPLDKTLEDRHLFHR